jgi:hypothetical protein
LKKRLFLLAVLSALPAFAQVPAGPVIPSTQPAPAKLFRSRLAGIQLLPPAGGTLIRKLGSGEIVRFYYAEKNWDIRVKPVPLHVSMSLKDLLDLTAKQLLQSNPNAEVISTTVLDKNVGVIEARYNSGVDRLFTQQALIRQDDQSYYLIQMGSPTDKPKNAPINPPDPRETEAHIAFTAMLPTVSVLDRQSLVAEQKVRLENTRALWVLLDQRKILQAMEPQHFMRIVRDGKDIGFVQVNERQASHGNDPGLETILRSRVENIPDEFIDQSKLVGPGPTGTGTVVPGLTPTPAVTEKKEPTNIYTMSTFYFSFDRLPGFVANHEDWETLTQMDQDKKNQVVERANSDVSFHRALDRAKLAEQFRVPTTQGSKDREPPIIERDDYVLSVSQDVKKRRAPSVDRKLTWFYLPQGLRQMLPRLLPLDESAQYMFSTYVSEQREVMARYVDVDRATDVTLDGKLVHAIPVSDRIGIDGLPTIHYMSPSGKWLGSISEEGRVQVLPATEEQLKEIWPGFAVSPLPPLSDPVKAGLTDPEFQPDGAEGR